MEAERSVDIRVVNSICIVFKIQRKGGEKRSVLAPSASYTATCEIQREAQDNNREFHDNVHSLKPVFL